jgi:hypothetical protein
MGRIFQAPDIFDAQQRLMRSKIKWSSKMRHKWNQHFALELGRVRAERD